jgi:hypothetical protein
VPQGVDELPPPGDTELPVGLGEMLFDRTLCDVQLAGDLPVRPATRRHRRHVLFLIGQRERVPARNSFAAHVMTGMAPQAFARS